MRRSLPSLAALTAVLLMAATGLAACGDRGAGGSTPKGPDAAAAIDPDVAMPEDAPPQEEAMAEEALPAGTAATGEARSCLSEIGAAASARLVERCIAVSPATHPPCNAQNDCATIQGEIDRSCAMYGPGETLPAQCTS